MTDEQKKDLIDTYNCAADDADRALNLVDYYADKEAAATDAKRKKDMPRKAQQQTRGMIFTWDE